MNTNDTLWNDLVACKQQQREIQDNLQKVLYFLMTVHSSENDKQSLESMGASSSHDVGMSGMLMSAMSQGSMN
jgi:hypothetical protein